MNNTIRHLVNDFEVVKTLDTPSTHNHKKLANLQNQKLFTEAVESGKLTVLEDGTVINNQTSREIGYKANNGYRSVGMKKDGKTRLILIHRLVYLIHQGELKADQEVNHIDGNKENNHVSNLEAVSLRENINHAYKSGLYDNAIKSKKNGYKGHNGNASKLTKDQALEIRNLFTTGKAKASDLAKRFGIHRTNVYRIVKGETYAY